MSLKNPTDHWGAVSQFLHWIIVAVLFAQAIIGLSLGSVPKSPGYFWVFNLHKSLGLTLLALAVLRLLWRAYAGAPIRLESIPSWQRRLASITQWLLYALLIALPLSGWLFDSASGLRPLRWFGLFEVPKLMGPNTGLREILRDAHGWIFWALAVLILMHVGAALYHHYFVGDATLRRMLPRRRNAAAASTGESG